MMETVMERPLKRTAEKGSMALLFCGHHGKQYSQSLELQGWTMLDFTDEIG
jgi:hypothetical protein